MKSNRKIPLVVFVILGLAIGCGGYEATDHPYEQTQLPNSVVLEQGIEFKVTPTRNLSPIDEEPGEIFSATLAEPIIKSEQLIAAKGAPVLGVVVLTRGPEGERDRIGFRLTELTVHGGETLQISTYTTYEFGSSKPSGGDSDIPPVIMTDEVLSFTLSEPVEVTYRMDAT